MFGCEVSENTTFLIAKNIYKQPLDLRKYIKMYNIKFDAKYIFIG